MDAMSAIEVLMITFLTNTDQMMDPKMDNGMTKDPVYDIDERIQLNLIPKDTSLSPHEIIGIMDQLLACEVFHTIIKKSNTIQVHMDQRIYFTSNIIYMSLFT